MNGKIRFGLIIVALACGLAGCAAGEMLGPLPVVDPTTAATVVVVRPYAVVGSAATFSVLVDGVNLCEIGPGEHVVIPAPPGEHLVAMRIEPLVGNALRASVRLVAEAKRADYFVTALDLSGTLTLTEVTGAEGEALVAE